MKEYALYTNLRKFDNIQIPAPFQNIILKDYCKKKKIKFSLPVEEYFFKNCYVELEGILAQKKKLKGIIMCSLRFLPQKKNYLDYFFNITRNLEVHFILEKIIIKNLKEYKNLYKDIEQIKNINEISKNIPFKKIKYFK